jgi:hypothetical protein
LKLKENEQRASEIWSTIPKDEILYPSSQEINIEAYLKDKNIETLKKIVEACEDLPIYTIKMKNWFFVPVPMPMPD